MVDNTGRDFCRFLEDRRSDLRRIALASRGEHQLSDVENSAWIKASELSTAKGIEISFLNRDFQEMLLGHLYQSLVRYTEKNIRHAIRLDHGSSEDPESPHPLMHILRSADAEPLNALIAREEELLDTEKHKYSHTLAGAYAHLLHRFDNRMASLANFLLISVSSARKRCAKAAVLARHQYSLPIDHQDRRGFRLRAWRRFKLQRIPVQLKLPFDDELELE